MKKETIRRVEVTIAMGGVFIKRVFTNVKEVTENESSHYVIHYDDNGDELQTMFSRSNVASIDWKEKIKGYENLNKEKKDIKGYENLNKEKKDI